MSQPEEDDVFVVIKPSGAAAAEAILGRLRAAGFTIVCQCWRTISAGDAELLYPDVVTRLRDPGSGPPGPLWAHHVTYLSSGRSLLAMARHREADGHGRMRLLKGQSAYSDQCAPGTIRHDFPGPAVFNSFHSCDIAAQSLAMRRYFRLTGAG